MIIKIHLGAYFVCHGQKCISHDSGIGVRCGYDTCICVGSMGYGCLVLYSTTMANVAISNNENQLKARTSGQMKSK